MNNIQLKKQIMRRVYTIWFMRLLVRPTAIKFYLLCIMLWQSFSYVSFASVIKNLPNITHIKSLYSFFAYAFLNTEAVVQVFAIAAMAIILWLIKDAYRNIYSCPAQYNIFAQ